MGRSQEKIYDHEINIAKVIDLIKLWTPSKPAGFLWGPPGIGKTSAVFQACQELKIKLIKFDASMKDPTDIRGILFIVDGKARYLQPDELPNIARDGERGILFCDELLFAVPAVQNNMHSLVLERKIGEYKFPKDWMIFAASNREDDRVQIFELSGPLANRFCHINVRSDFETDLKRGIIGWDDWAIKNGIDPLIISYLKTHPDRFSQKPDSQISYATPRSWQFVNDFLNSKMPEDLQRACISGCVGAGVEVDLYTHREIGMKALKIIEEIEKGKFDNVPKESGSNSPLIWTINIYFATKLAQKYTDSLGDTTCEYIMKLASKLEEFATHMAILAIRSKEKITSRPMWINKIAPKLLPYLM